MILYVVVGGQEFPSRQGLIVGFVAYIFKRTTKKKKKKKKKRKEKKRKEKEKVLRIRKQTYHIVYVLKKVASI